MMNKHTPSETRSEDSRSEIAVTTNHEQNSELDAMAVVYKILQPLSPDEQARVLSWVEGKLGLKDGRQFGNESRVGGEASSATSESLQVSAKRFLAEKKPRTDLERITCLAYYQTHLKGSPKFKTRELTELNKDAAQSPFSNTAFAVVNATNAKYLAPAGGGYKQITVRGETLVEALPDPQRVRVALEANPLGRSRRKTGRSNRSK
jgi:hypothetical protein